MTGECQQNCPLIQGVDSKLHCADHSGTQARLQSVEQTVSGCLPELQGAVKDVNTCLNQITETVKTILKLEKEHEEVFRRLREVEAKQTHQAGKDEAMEKHMDQKIRQQTVWLTLLIAVVQMIGWFVR